MKKLALTIAIVLGLGLTSFADPEGLFNRASSNAGGNTIFNGSTRNGDVPTPALPVHGETTNQNAPLGSGIAVLTALGAAYLVGKRRKED